MILYIARHGQPALDDMPKGGNYELPDNDYVLTPLGREQAEYLGKQLQKKNFKGKIFSSPYARTMETATIAASFCGATVAPEPRFQERLFYPEAVCPGMTIEEIRKNYPHIAPDATLEFPWIVQKGPEEPEDVQKRVIPYLDELIADPPAEEVLLVGHGASVSITLKYLAQKAGFTGDLGYSWNASLSAIEISKEGAVRIIESCTFDFMPIEKVTSNRRRFTDPEQP